MTLTLDAAQTIIKVALDHGRAANFKPLGIVILDIRGAVKAAVLQDGSSLSRFDIARAKAKACLAFDRGTRAFEKIATDRLHFFIGAASAVEGGLVPVAGGVLIRDKNGTILGAVGVSGDTSDNDEAAAVAGINAAGLVADGG
ncbi:MAG: heme-binding protein [Proteobacteria bacterium]|nr:heme-binding protein [Pseudomonadota bacterium]